MTTAYTALARRRAVKMADGIKLAKRDGLLERRIRST